MKQGRKRGTMTPSDAHDALLHHIYDAALDPALWPRFLGAFAASYPGGQGAMYTVDPRRASVLLASWDPAWTARHNAHFHSTNPWLPRMRARPAGVTNAAEDLMDPHDFRRTEYFNDFLRPQGIRTGVGATVARRGGRIVGVSVLYRSDRTEDADMQRLQRLVPHLARAVDVNHALHDAAAAQAVADAALDRLGQAAAVLDAEGRMALCNSRAGAFLCRGAGLRLRAGGQVEAPGQPGATATLHGLVRSAASGVAATDKPGGWMQIPRLDGAPVSVLVAPLPAAPDGPAGFLAGRQGMALMIVFDPDEAAPVGESALRQRFGLTAAEARVAALLAGGKPPAAIAAALGLRPSTVRQSVKAVLAKTGTHSQVELLRALRAGA